MHSLRQFINELKRRNDLLVIDKRVNPDQEIAEIHRRFVAKQGPALLFTNVIGSSFPVVTNLYGTIDRVNLAFGIDKPSQIEDIVKIVHEQMPPNLATLWNNRSLISELIFKLGKRRKWFRSPILDCVHSGNNVDMNALPLLKSWPLDGGSFITLPLVYTESVVRKNESNLGMYRVQRHQSNQVGLHFQIGKGGGYHYQEAEKLGKPLPVTVFIGGPPALTLSAISPLPEGIPEWLLASFLLGNKIPYTRHSNTPHMLFSECEFAISGFAYPHERKDEGPFGDHYGIYSLKHPYPVCHVHTIYHRKDAIYPATVVGVPPQEDYYIGEYLQELLKPLLHMVMPSVQNCWSYGESGFHTITTIVSKERYRREMLSSAFRVLGEGQLSLTKCLFVVTDTTINIKDFLSVLKHVLERFDPKKDLIIINHTSLDTLDYSSSKINSGSRLIWLGTGEKKRQLPKQPPDMIGVRMLVPGCLLVESEESIEYIQNKFALLTAWPLIFVVDNCQATHHEFLWSTFIRFDPANHLHAPQRIVSNHIEYSLPVIIDARSKSFIPNPVCVDEAIQKNVDTYFHVLEKGIH